MKAFKIFLFFIGLISLNYSICYAGAPTIIDKIGQTTIYIMEQKIAIINKSGREYEVWLKDPKKQTFEPNLNTITGTGFIVVHNGFSYIVTAAHVAHATSPDTLFIFNQIHHQGGYNTLRQQEKTKKSRWFYHPNADIAIHPFGISRDNTEIKYIDENLFASDSDEIPIGSKVVILGYPLSLGINDYGVSPLCKNTEIGSWITTINIPGSNPNLKFILLDDSLAQGYSGSPVFTYPEPQIGANNKVKLIGIVSGTLSDETGGKITLIVPTSYLREILESQEIKEFESLNKEK